MSLAKDGFLVEFPESFDQIEVWAIGRQMNENYPWVISQIIVHEMAFVVGRVVGEDDYQAEDLPLLKFVAQGNGRLRIDCL